MKCQECGKEIVLTISRILFWGCREMLCAKCAQGREDLKKVTVLSRKYSKKHARNNL